MGADKKDLPTDKTGAGVGLPEDKLTVSKKLNANGASAGTVQPVRKNDEMFATAKLTIPPVNENDYSVDLNYPPGKLGAMTRKANEVKTLLRNKSSENKTRVLSLMKEFAKKKENFEEACLEQRSLPGVAHEDMDDFVSWCNQHNCVANEFEVRVTGWLDDPSPDDLEAGDSASQVTTGSSRSGRSSSVRSRLVEKEISVKTKLKKLKQKKEFEEKQRKIEMEFKAKQQLLKREAEELDLECELEGINELKNELDRIDLGEECENFDPRKENINGVEFSQILHKQNYLSELLISNQAKALLPNNEPDTFDGKDVTKYAPFILSFERLIASRCPNDADKFYYLLKFTSGTPHDLVLSCNSDIPSEAYAAGWNILDKNYGDELVIAQRYIEKLCNWPNVPSENVTALGDLRTYLTTCNNMMKKMSYLSQLNSWKEIKIIVMKLPWDIRKSFRGEVCRLRKNGIILDFNLFVKFIDNQYELLSVPVFGEIKESDVTIRTSKRNDFQKQKLFTLQDSSDVSVPCPCCSKTNHNLDSCHFFRKKSLTEREQLIRLKGLCFGCLQSTSHRSRNCQNKISCTTCHKLHPTSLHRENSIEERNERANFTEQQEEIVEGIDNDPSDSSINPVENPTVNNELPAGNNVKAHNISSRQGGLNVMCPSVPVMIRKLNSNEYVRTYLGMDTFATGSYIDDELVKSLAADGPETVLSLTTMEAKSQPVTVKAIENIEAISIDGKRRVIIPKMYSKKNWPFELHDSPKYDDVKHIPELRKLPFGFIPCKIGILIGMNYPDIVKPQKIVNSTTRGPYASEHQLGWALNGPTNGSDFDRMTCFRTAEKNPIDVDERFEKCFARDFEDDDVSVAPSNEDILWEKKVTDSIRKLSDGHYEIALPFKSDKMDMPDNYLQAYNRLKGTRKRLMADEELQLEYKSFIDTMLIHNFIERVPACEMNSTDKWFLTHHGVRHKQKNKFRIVFNCSLKYKGVSLNDMLLQGPDLTNDLVGVLLRFRQERVAFSADIEKMFLMVRVPKGDSNFMRFLWYPEHNFDVEPVQFRVMVHIFGAISSPSCANFALRSAICDHEDSKLKIDKSYRSKHSCDAIIDAFYVDDLMKSTSDDEKAVKYFSDVSEMLIKGGFNLTQLVSNSRRVLSSFPEKLSKSLGSIDIACDELPYENALGVKWNVENDTLGFRVNLDEQPCTKRGVLATIFSVYDPLFITCPMIIGGKRVFQEACELKLLWDDPLPDHLASRWKRWISQLRFLKNYEIPRCYIGDGAVGKSVQLHVFCDGSEIAYGSVAYVRHESTPSQVNATIIMAKARLTPLNRSSLKTIPRIELNSAKLAVSLYLKLMKELEIKFHDVCFWTDSTTVLNYINSESARFHRFVANRVAFIRNHTNVSQWRHVPGKFNPADVLSRGATDSSKFVTSQEWISGPEFLRKSADSWPVSPSIGTIEDVDAEVKKPSLNLVVNTELNAMNRLLLSTFDWHKLRCRVWAVCKFAEFLRTKTVSSGMNVSDIMKSEICIFKYLQREYFSVIITGLANNQPLSRKDPLSKLKLYIDENDIVRVGGRISNSSIPVSSRNPILLPKSSPVVSAYVTFVHLRSGHMGREYMIAEMRQYVHIVGINATVKKILRMCIICRKTQGKPQQQLMADLPLDRLQMDNPPFTNTGTDYFGPFMVARGRGQVKRYGVIFTCLVSRAVHIEVAHTLDTSGFINALRRFIARRGCVKLIRSDNGGCYVAGNRELNDSIKQWNDSQISDTCLEKGIDWKFQPPNASNFGGVFERMIRTVRKILNSLLQEFSGQVSLTDDSLSTLLCEVEAIINNRPLTAVTNDPNDLDALTPFHLLGLSFECSFPPGIFENWDCYSRRRWRQVQFLTDVFWSRFRKEYLPLLMSRQKWIRKTRSLCVGDLVLVVDQLLPRNMWSIGRVISVNPDLEGNVRRAHVKVARRMNGKHLKFGTTTFERSSNKLILLRAHDEL